MTGFEVEKMTGQKPVAQIKGGNNISVALWENQIQIRAKTVTMLKASLQKRYKGKNGDWQTSNSYSKADIPDAVFCLQKAFEKMIEMQNEESSNNSDVEEEAVM